MIWPFKRKQSGDVKIFLDAGKRIFGEVATYDFPASVFAQEPALKKQMWRELESDLTKWIGNEVGVSRERTMRLREQWAEWVEHFALAAYYVNLKETDRDVFAKYALQSTMQQQD